MSLAAIATLVVALGFTALVIWVLLPGNRSRLEQHGHIPLNDDSEDRP